MLNKIKIKIKKNTEIFALSLLIFITIIATSYHNYTKAKVYSNYKNITNNVYLQKTINYFFDNLEPKFKKINHQVAEGETFDNILENYSIDKTEIKNIKKELLKKVNLNKLNTNHKIQFTLDQSTNLIKEFIFKVSNTEKIYLSKDTKTEKFNQEIILTKLKKDILYKENIINQSLYKSAIDKRIPPNIIIEFARIYGFQVDFQRDIRKQDAFQIMFEIFVDDKNRTIETGNILYSNLKLSGQDNSLYYFSKEGSEGHYDKNGKSIKKALMKTPINDKTFISIWNEKTIDGFNKMHQGLICSSNGYNHGIWRWCN